MSSGSLSKDIEKNIAFFQPYVDENADLSMRRVVINNPRQTKCAVMFLEGVTNQQLIEQDILRSLLETYCKALDAGEVMRTGTASSQQMALEGLDETLEMLFSGFTVLLIDGVSKAIVVDMHGGASRSVEESSLDKTILGARDGFVENLVPNVALIRRRLRTKELVVLNVYIGRQTNTRTAILYMKDRCDPRLPEEIKNRLENAQLEQVLTIGDVRPVISDQKSIFPTVKAVERPDTVCSMLIKGKVAVICDQQPIALVSPASFKELFESPNDAAIGKPLGKILQFVRMAGFIISVALPGIYISLLNFSRSLLPSEMASMLTAAESMVPIPLTIEVIVVDLLVLLIFEVGISLPTVLGGTIGVFGSIVLGQALVNSQFTSEATLLVVIISAMSGYIISNYPLANSMRLLRYGVIIMAGFFGLFGVSIALLLLICRLNALSTLGSPYIYFTARQDKPRKKRAETIDDYKKRRGLE